MRLISVAWSALSIAANATFEQVSDGPVVNRIRLVEHGPLFHSRMTAV